MNYLYIYLILSIIMEADAEDPVAETEDMFIRSIFWIVELIDS